MDAAQGLRKGVPRDVTVSGLPGSRARSAVFLVHTEALRQAPGEGIDDEFARRPWLSSGCYHTRSGNVL